MKKLDFPNAMHDASQVIKKKKHGLPNKSDSKEGVHNSSSWQCNECKFINNAKNNDSNIKLTCIKCNAFVTSLNFIEDQLINVMKSIKHAKSESSITHSAIEQIHEILLLFLNEQFIKYHTISKIENLLLYFTNLIIEFDINITNVNQIFQLLVSNEVCCNYIISFDLDAIKLFVFLFGIA